MKKLCVFLSVLFAAIAFQGCDSKPTEVVRTVHDTDTVYTDRFARKSPVVWGEWNFKLNSGADSAQLIFLQDSSAVSGHFFWKKNPRQWTLDGSITGQTIRITKDSFIVSGKFTDSAFGKVTRIKGILFNTGNEPSSDSFTAVRTN